MSIDMFIFRKTLFLAVVCIAVFSVFACAADTANYSRTELPNGMTVLVKPETGAGIVAIEVFIRAGADAERESNAGIGAFVARTLLTGTRNRRAESVASVVDSVGGNLQVEWTQDYTEIKAITTSANFDEAVGLIADVLTNADFRSSWIETVRQEILREMDVGDDDIFVSAYSRMKRLLYADNPYGRPSLGYRRTVRSITSDDLRAFYEKYYVPSNVVISIAGDITREHAEDRVKKAFAGTGKKEAPKPRPIPYETLERSNAEIQERQIKVAYLMLGCFAPGVNSPDYPAAQVAAVALGVGKGSRMFQILREEKGLAYELGVIYPRLKNQSHIAAYIVTDPYRRTLSGMNIEMMLTEVKDALVSEINRMGNELLSPNELERAKKFAIGRYALDHQRLRDRAFYLGWAEAVGVGAEFDSAFSSRIEAVTAEDVRRVARKYFNNYVVVIVLPKE